MCLNEHMKVFVCHGYYDLVTPYFHSERMVGLMKLTKQQRDRQMRQTQALSRTSMSTRASASTRKARSEAVRTRPLRRLRTP